MFLDMVLFKFFSKIHSLESSQKKKENEVKIFNVHFTMGMTQNKNMGNGANPYHNPKYNP